MLVPVLTWFGCAPAEQRVATDEYAIVDQYVQMLDAAEKDRFRHDVEKEGLPSVLKRVDPPGWCFAATIHGAGMYYMTPLGPLQEEQYQARKREAFALTNRLRSLADSL